MKILALYVNRNKVLADYTNEEINFKVFDFGRAVNNLIFMRDFEFGMDTEEKRKNYEMLVTELKDIVHDCLLSFPALVVKMC
jgi:coproporphyrinogen III oxidase